MVLHASVAGDVNVQSETFHDERRPIQQPRVRLRVDPPKVFTEGLLDLLRPRRAQRAPVRDVVARDHHLEEPQELCVVQSAVAAVLRVMFQVPIARDVQAYAEGKVVIHAHVRARLVGAQRQMWPSERVRQVPVVILLDAEVREGFVTSLHQHVVQLHLGDVGLDPFQGRPIGHHVFFCDCLPFLDISCRRPCSCPGGRPACCPG